MTFKVSKETKEKLKAEAKAKGVTLSELVERKLCASLGIVYLPEE